MCNRSVQVARTVKHRCCLRAAHPSTLTECKHAPIGPQRNSMVAGCGWLANHCNIWLQPAGRSLLCWLESRHQVAPVQPWLVTEDWLLREESDALTLHQVRVILVLEGSGRSSGSIKGGGSFTYMFSCFLLVVATPAVSPSALPVFVFFFIIKSIRRCVSTWNDGKRWARRFKNGNHDWLPHLVDSCVRISPRARGIQSYTSWKCDKKVFWIWELSSASS